jgi:hypothetical protein
VSSRSAASLGGEVLGHGDVPLTTDNGITLIGIAVTNLDNSGALQLMLPFDAHMNVVLDRVQNHCAGGAFGARPRDGDADSARRRVHTRAGCRFRVLVRMPWLGVLAGVLYFGGVGVAAAPLRTPGNKICHPRQTPKDQGSLNSAPPTP